MALASLTDRIPVTRAEAVKERSAPGQVTGRLKCAMDAMIWEGASRATAAKKANMSEHSLYAALRRPHVKAYYLAELDVLRTSERARNIHALVDVRDESGNAMARVQAVKTLEQISDEAAGNQSSATPAGLTIVVQTVNQAPFTGPVIEQLQDKSNG